MTWRNLFWHWSTQNAFLDQIDQNAPSQPWGQKWSKLSQNNIFHVSTSNLSYLVILSTLTKFDLRLTLGSTRNSNFYLTIRTG